MHCLYHYSQHPVKKILNRSYISRLWMVYDLNKPQGFWFAVEYPDDTDDFGWYQLCTRCEEGIMVRRVRYKYAVKILKQADILMIETEDKLHEFVRTYGYHEVRHETHPWSIEDIRIEWLQIYRRYDGIIIAPYKWNLRESWYWYNEWDVASGCVWNTHMIESIQLVEKRDIRKIKNTPYFKMKDTESKGKTKDDLLRS